MVNVERIMAQFLSPTDERDEYPWTEVTGTKKNKKKEEFSKKKTPRRGGTMKAR
jgi:hypothetical protein